jgi:hypothetical protein
VAPGTPLPSTPGLPAVPSPGIPVAGSSLVPSSTALAVLPGAVAPTAALPRTRVTADASRGRSTATGSSAASRTDASASRGATGSNVSNVQRRTVAAEQQRCLAAAAAGIGGPRCDEVAIARTGAGGTPVAAEPDSGPLAWSGRHIRELLLVGAAAIIAGFAILAVRRRLRGSRAA